MSELRAAVLEQWRRHPVWVAIILGLLLRTVSALSGFGWFAADDYYYVVEPAWRWLDDSSLTYVSRIRSQLFPRVFYLLLSVGDVLADDPRWVLRIGYLGLGLLSLAVIPGVHALSARRWGPDVAAVAALLAATYALMPRVATRALIEGGAMLPLVWSFVLFDASVRGSGRGRFARALAGGILFAVAAMVRFQVGVMIVAVIGWMVWQARRRPADESARVAWAPVIGLAVAGAVGVAMQCVVDVAFDRPPFGTLAAYVSMNVEQSSRFGESAWYTYLLHLVLFTVPPVTLALVRPLWRACRQHALVSISVAVFVLAHSLVPHKEDRFLFPVLPLLLVLLAAGLVELRRGGPWQRRAWVFFWVINCVALPLACLSDAQRSMTVPLLEIAAIGGSHDVVVVGARRVPLYYLGTDHRARSFRRMKDFLTAAAHGDVAADFILARPAPSPENVARISAAGFSCGEPRVFTGDWVDRALVVLNSRRNKRRRPTGLFDCRPLQRPH